jgi:hypothetical protein
MTEVKGHIGQLHERMNHLDMMVDELSRTVTNLQFEPIQSYGLDGMKKRKIDSVPLNRGTSLELMMSMAQNINESDDGFDPTFWNAFDEMGQMNPPEESDPKEPSSSASIGETSQASQPASTLLSVNDAMDRSDQIVSHAQISDISSILTILPSHLQERFVDKLASSLGDKLSKELNLPVPSKEPESEAPDSTAVTAVTATPVTPQTVMVPSDQQVATCAYSAAALGAFLTSCRLAEMTAGQQVFNSPANYTEMYRNFYTTKPLCTGADALEPVCY